MPDASELTNDGTLREEPVVQAALDRLHAAIAASDDSVALSVYDAVVLYQALRPPKATDSTPSVRHGNHYGHRLVVAIELDALVIRIGVQTLADAVRYADWANPFDEQANDYIRTFAILDPLELAKDAKRAMLCEREDGSSPLSDFLDKATEDAINDGSTACDEARIRHGETSPLETWAEA